jgi:hypothetical protein
MERMDNDKTLAHYHVPPVGPLPYLKLQISGACTSCRADLPAKPPSSCASTSRNPARPFASTATTPNNRLFFQGCKVMLALEKAKLESGLPDPDSPYWN